MLALSGGGYRGLYTAKILADLEQDIGGAYWPTVRSDSRHIHRWHTDINQSKFYAAPPYSSAELSDYSRVKQAQIMPHD